MYMVDVSSCLLSCFRAISCEGTKVWELLTTPLPGWKQQNCRFYVFFFRRLKGRCVIPILTPGVDKNLCTTT